MSRFSIRVPEGFVVALGDLYFMDSAPLDASPEAISRLYQGEDLLVLEHLVLDGSVHLDARAGVFVVTVYTSPDATEHVVRTSETLGAALKDLDELARSMWSLRLPWRESDSIYGLEDEEAQSHVPGSTWIVPARWVVLTDRLGPEPTSETLRLVFAASTSHRSLAVYRVEHEGRAAFAAFFWYDPPGSLYERAFFDTYDALVPWLRRRLDHQKRLPKRKRRP